MHNFYNFPEYLRHNAKWAVWRYVQEDGKAKPSKPPFHPGSGDKISVLEPETWASFDECIAAYGDGTWWQGVGFLIEQRLNVTVVDLDYRDNRPADIATLHERIYQKLNTYTEVSPSGKGLHIVSRGTVPAARRFDVEVYSQQRFMTVTGNVLHNVPIVDNQETLERLVQEIAGERKKTGSLEQGGPQFVEDDVIIQRGFSAQNGDKFRNLWEGNWQILGYPSQSEADFALINMLCYYTQNVPQIRRIFFQSALGQRDKLATRPELLNQIIAKGFDKLLPEIDISALQEQVKAVIAKQAQAQVIPAAVSSSGKATSGAIAPPPGLLGELCQWYYRAAPYPAPEIALAGGLGFMAGLCGAGYRIGGDALNLFLLLTAPSGTGKDILTSGSHRLLKACKQHPMMFTGTKLNAEWISSIIGPSSIASGQALTKHIKQDFMSMLSIQPEFGIEMQRLNDPYASGSMKALRSAYLKLAGSHTLGKEIWADLDKTIESREGVAFTLLGESVPQKIFETLSIDDIGDGFLGRLLLIECPVTRDIFQSSAWAVEPDPTLVEHIIKIGGFAAEQARLKQPISVNWQPEAFKIADAHRGQWRAKHSGAGVAAYNVIWARAYAMVCRLSSLIAVGRNHTNPVIEIQDVEWSADVVQRGIGAIVKRFEGGEIGHGADEKITATLTYLKRYVNGTAPKNKQTYNEEWQTMGIIGRSLLRQYVSGLTAFRADKMAFNDTLRAMIAEGYLAPVMPGQLEGFGKTFTGEVYKIMPSAVR